jgi:hypothetical protein
MSKPLEKLVKTIKELREYEEDGRRRAYDRDGLPKSDALWAIGVAVKLNDAKVLDEIEYMPKAKYQPELAAFNMLTWVFDQALDDMSIAADNCLSKNVKRKDCLIDPKILIKVDSKAEELFGSRCTWLAGELPPERYNLSAALNDASACLHRTIEYLEKYATKWHKEGKCLWRED